MCGESLAHGAESCPSCGGAAQGGELPVVLGPGDKIGHYLITRVIGRGGFGVTYDADDLALGRRVAIKECFPEGSVRQNGRVTGGAGFLELRTRFLNEARVMATLPAHPSLAKVHDLVEDLGTAYIAMEFVPGPTAREALDASPGGLPEATVLAIVFDICNALDVVHTAGHLHRDVKPENIIIRPDEHDSSRTRSVLVDFGSARTFDANRTGNMTQQVTHGYAPLEQYGRSQRFGPSLDVYALAGTAYHLLTGVAPPSAPDRANGEPLVPASSRCEQVSQRVSDAISYGMAMAPIDRPSDMTAFRVALQPLPALPPAQEVKHQVSWPSRLLIAAGGVFGIVPIAIVALALNSWLKPDPTPLPGPVPVPVTSSTVPTLPPSTEPPTSAPNATTTLPAGPGPSAGTWHAKTLIEDGLLTNASGVLITKDGVLVADYGSNRVVNASAAGAGVGPVLNQPADLAVSDSGAVYVVETGANRVSRIGGPPIVGTGTAGAGRSGQQGVVAALNGPSDVATSGSKVYVVDRGNNRVVTVDLVTGEFVVVADGIENMAGIAVDKSGRIYVSRPKLGVVSVVSGDGSTSDVVALKGKIVNPSGIAMDENGTLYIADAAQKEIVVMDSKGRVGTLATDVELSGPLDVSVDRSRVVVLDAGGVLELTR